MALQSITTIIRKTHNKRMQTDLAYSLTADARRWAA